jgi:hypothetical protein
MSAQITRITLADWLLISDALDAPENQGRRLAEVVGGLLLDAVKTADGKKSPLLAMDFTEYDRFVEVNQDFFARLLAQNGQQGQAQSASAPSG